MKKVHKKRSFLLDKIPYILFVLISIIAVIIFFSVRSCLPLTFFSGTPKNTENDIKYSLFIASPSSGQIFDFINQNETVPVKIRAKEAESTDYIIKVMVNGSEIKTFTLPPYEYNWNPGSSGEYEIVALLLDDNDNIIAESNTINFTVAYKIEPENETPVSVDIEEKKNNVIDQSVFRTNNTIPTGVPIFSYKCYTPPVIDGIIQEWDKFESFSSFAPTIKKENYTTHTDISGTFYSCWDDDNFYFAIHVIDDVFSQNYTGNQINKGDSVTLVFDTELEGDMQITFYNSDDYQIDFSPGNFAGIPAESFMNWPTNAPPRGTTIAPARTRNGYILEVSLPWYNFTNYMPEDEDVLGFTVSILDTDNLDTTELVISSSKTFDFNNVSTLGAIALIDAGDLQDSGDGNSDSEAASE
jgi:hypothetical protein